jgi:hypothetical protein
VIVEFDRFYVSESLDGRGPIYGEFWANDEMLSFDGADPDLCDLGEAFAIGLYLGGEVPPDSMAGGIPMDVAHMFHLIEYWQDRCPEAESYEAPGTTAVSVGVPEGESLSIGMEIWEYNRDGDDILLCSPHCEIAYDDFEDAFRYVSPYPCPSREQVYRCPLLIYGRVYDWSH